MKLFATLVCILILASCTPSISKDSTIARVNSSNISVRDYLNLYDTLKPKELTPSGKQKAELKNLVLKNLVRRAVILSEADRRKINLSDEELERGIQEFQAGYKDGSFEQSLLEQMVDQKEWRELVKQNLLIEKIFSLTDSKIPEPSLQEEHEYYQTNMQLFHQNEQATALQIVVSEKNLADDLYKQLLTTPSAFVSLAKKHSVGPEKDVGAKITIEKGTLPEELDRALFKEKIGSIQPVIKSDYGFHILKVLSRSPALNQSFEDVQSRIIAHLKSEHRKLLLLKFEEQLIRSATIEYNRKLIAEL